MWFEAVEYLIIYRDITVTVEGVEARVECEVELDDTPCEETVFVVTDSLVVSYAHAIIPLHPLLCCPP
jgi:hypothetical protein